MEYSIQEIDNILLANLIRNNQIESDFLSYRLDGGFIHIRENQSFFTEVEQNIKNHFIFMLRISFYDGLFQEITNFINTYQTQYHQSVQIYEVWSQINQIIANTKNKMEQAQNYLKNIDQIKSSGVTNQEFQKQQRDHTKMFLDKQFMLDSAMEQKLQEQKQARQIAQAETNIKYGQEQLMDLGEQLENQNKFTQDLQRIKGQWDYDYRTFLEGRTFIDSINLNQVQIFQNKEWESPQWLSLLNQQIQEASPYFTSLYQKYLECYRFYLANYELDELTKNKQLIQETQIKIAERIAEKRFNEAFIQYWTDQLIEAERTFKVLQTNDEVKRLQECHTRLTQQLIQVQQAYQNLNLNVSFGGGVVDDVSLIQTELYFQLEDPFQVQYSQETLSQIQNIKQIQLHIQQFENELRKLEQAQLRLQVLEEQPKIIKSNVQILLEEKISQADIFKAQFEDLIKQTQVENYNDLSFGRQGMMHILGALCKFIVIKKTPCCYCFSGSKKIHQFDYIDYNEFEEQAAYVIRQFQNQKSSWFKSSKERIEKANQMNVIQIGTRLIINTNILAALRNDNGQRQINNGKRVFNAYGSIAYTINELCSLAVADYKIQIGLESQRALDDFKKWRLYQENAKNGKHASNQGYPQI